MRRGDAAVSAVAPALPLVLIGSSATALRLADEIQSAADAACVLVDSETGLETVEIAHEIHARSGRRGPFLALDCAAAEPGAIECELFGEQPRRALSDLVARTC